MTVPLVDWILVFIIIIVAPMCIAHELIMSCIQRYLPRRTVCIGRTSLALLTTVVERIEKEPKANPAFWQYYSLMDMFVTYDVPS